MRNTRLVGWWSCAFASSICVFACSSDPIAPGAPPADSGTVDAAARDADKGDAGKGDGGTLEGDAGGIRDASAAPDACAASSVASKLGETCIGFGTGTTCNTACGLPAFGYVCFAGGPPNLNGCQEASKSALGNTYCCPDRACVAQPDQNVKCTNGRKRFQCLANSQGTLLATPAAACQEDLQAAGSNSRFYCCP